MTWYDSQRAPSKRILKKIFCISQRAPSKRILNFFLGFQIPPIFCISQQAPSKRILNFFLGFQIPPIFCISYRRFRSPKKNLKFFFGLSDPANFLHQPATIGQGLRTTGV
jgi:hypothetical protein